jgi:anti-sigma factor RsiW
MNCTDSENLLLEALDQSLLAADRDRLDDHLRVCPDCRAFEAAQRQIDSELTQALPRPSLPATFAARLQRRIQAAEATSPITPNRETLRAAAEADHLLWQKRLRLGRIWRQHTLWLDLLGYATLAGIVGFLLTATLGPATTFASALVRDERALAIFLAAGAVGGVALGAGFWLLFQRRNFV